MVNKGTNILLIESPNLLNIAYCVVMRRKYGEIYYINNNLLLSSLKKKGLFSWLKLVVYSDFEGSFFDAGEAGYQEGLDIYYDKIITNVYKKLITRYYNSYLWETALKKELFYRYTEKKIKVSIFLKYLNASNKNLKIYLVPGDNDEFIIKHFIPSEYKEPYRIPSLFRVLIPLFEKIKNIVMYLLWPILTLYLLVKYLLRGFSHFNCKERYEFGFDTYNGGINFERPYHEFFFYDSENFHHSKILHVVRNSFNNSLNSAKTKYFFEKNNINYVEMDNIKIDIRFFVKTILWDFYLLSLIRILKGIFSNKNYRFFLPAIAVMKMKIDAEIFYSRYNVKVFIFRDEYSPFHIVRTIVAHSHQNKTFGFSHGDDCHHSGYINSIVCSRFALWGDFNKKYLSKTFKYTKTEIIGAGIYGLDKTFEWQKKGFVPLKYRDVVGKKRIIMIFASSFSPDLYITKELTLKFYEDVLDITENYNDFIRVIKPKGDEFDGPEFKELLHDRERVILEDSLWIYKALIVADLVICINVSTIGLEAMMAGKKVLYYDVSGNKYHAYAKYSESLVAYDKESLKRNVDLVLSEGKYIDDELLADIKNEHGYMYDGKVVNRMREICQKMSKE